MTTNWNDVTGTAARTDLNPIEDTLVVPLWFLSFVDRDAALAAPKEDQRPGGAGFLGGCIVEGTDFEMAVRLSHALGINPGGEVKGTGPLDPDPRYIETRWKNRLLNATELDEMEETLGNNLAKMKEEDGA